MAEIEKAICLWRLAQSWDTTAEALRMHIFRYHGRDSKIPIFVFKGRILEKDVIALQRTYLKPKPKTVKRRKNKKS